MGLKQINLKLSPTLISAAAIRERIFGQNQFDETFTDQEIALIDSLIETSVNKNLLVSEKELNIILL